MTTFPSLIPSTRTYSPGEFPHTAHPLLSGAEIRVRHSNTVLGVRLRLTFQAVASADLVAVRNHYNGRRGGFLPFAIPDELLSGVTTPADFTPAGHQWVYAARPRVVDVPIAGPTPTNRHDLVVELATVPPENTIVAGARIICRAILQAGSAERGAFLEAFASLDAGAASAQNEVLALGATFVADAILTAGAASSTSSFDPSSLSPLAWWDASDDTTITTSSGLITDWEDKSGNGWHLAQGEATQRPAYVTAAVNGLNAADWPSTNNNDFLQSASGTFTAAEYYSVVVFDRFQFANYEGLLNGAGGASSESWFTGGQDEDSLSTSANTHYINGNTGTNRYSDMFPELQDGCLVRSFRSSGDMTTTNGVVLGMDRNLSGLNRGWKGYICEVVAFSTALSSGDRADLETYLMDKWGI